MTTHGRGLDTGTAPSPFDLRGCRALVTGAARGIGAGAAESLAWAGASVLLFDKRADELTATCKRLSDSGALAMDCTGDVTVAADLDRLRCVVADDFGPIDVLVNNAGVMRRVAAVDATLDDLDAVWQVNARGLFAVTQLVLPSMIQRRRGKIINVGSLGTLLGLKNRSVYAMTKGAVGQYTRSLAAELGPYGICANAIAPGYVDTGMAGELIRNHDAKRDLLARIPLGRFADPADLAGTFVFLASPASDYLTGQIIAVDGGWTAW